MVRGHCCPVFESRVTPAWLRQKQRFRNLLPRGKLGASKMAAHKFDDDSIISSAVLTGNIHFLGEGSRPEFADNRCPYGMGGRQSYRSVGC